MVEARNSAESSSASSPSSVKKMYQKRETSQAKTTKGPSKTRFDISEGESSNAPWEGPAGRYNLLFWSANFTYTRMWCSVIREQPMKVTALREGVTDGDGYATKIMVPILESRRKRRVYTLKAGLKRTIGK
ncbi:hypothetical protein B0H16DRAFT_1471954 [Mycena metata]|uniref:Uncharacterized protein n=1 Tax=Mycena metata TaxID=1033252 RepID=A0AAD7MN85_9AGAR|nr:hypothetical protein B0H16DRAFT_1471954 [Mycena metata]